MQGFETGLLFVASPLLGWAVWSLRLILPPANFALLLAAGVAAASLIAVRGGPAGVEPMSARSQSDTAAPVAVEANAPAGAVLSSLVEETPATIAGFDRETAVYDISAHTVHLPDGTKLEAHSGLGARLDDPRYVHERMRGATPPNVYDLSFREKPFHGVRALRLKPVDREKTFGRTGLLAHTYMLGPKGDSNGCVVFRDYRLFLQAFEAGVIKRLAVVARLDDAGVASIANIVAAARKKSENVTASAELP
jgi:hypothetical protein